MKLKPAKPRQMPRNRLIKTSIGSIAIGPLIAGADEIGVH